MPLNVRRLYTSILLVTVSLVLSAGAQTPPASPPQTVAATPATTLPKPPTSGDVMRTRISKAKAFIAVRNYNAAIFELENIRRETSDATVHGAVNVLLMNSYLDQGDFKRAQDLLNEFYAAQKTTKANAPASYMAVAGQIVKGARDRAERYRTLGLSVTDRTLPLEATNDLEKMRETLELVITQSKEIGTDKAKTPDAMALLEEASNSRGMLARDDYDSRRWKDELADTREKLVNSGGVVISAMDVPPAPVEPTVAAAKPPGTTQPATQTVADGSTNTIRDREVKSPEPAPTTVASNNEPIYIPSAPPTVKEQPKAPATAKETEKQPNTQPSSDDQTASNAEPMDVGSLLPYATRQPQPVYPTAAKSVRTTGTVKVEVMVNEEGEVAEIQKASGPIMLQSAAKEAVRNWKFKPFVRDGQPVKATGFVSFRFAL